MIGCSSDTLEGPLGEEFESSGASTLYITIET